MTTPHAATLEPVHAHDAAYEPSWSARLVLFLRVMAGISLLKGLFHWSIICGIGGESFESYTSAYQAGTIYFAVIDLVAAVGLWLAAPWGAVVWLTAVISMIAIEVIFPQVYGRGLWVAIVEVAMLAAYLSLALMSAREQTG